MNNHKSALADKKIIIGDEREDWLSTVFDSMPQMAGILDTEGRILDVNKTALLRIRAKIEEVLGEYFWETSWWTYEPELSERVRSAVSRARLGEVSVFETSARSRDGRERHISFTCEPLYNSEGEIRYILALGTDISEVRKLDVLIEEHSRNFRVVFEKSGDASLLIRGDQIIDCNEAALRLFGAERASELIGKTIPELSPERQQDGENSTSAGIKMASYMEHDAAARFEWIHKDLLGKEFFTEVVLTKIVTGGHSYRFASLRDISERKKMEEELRRVSFFDRLTGLYNRHYFEEEVERIEGSREKNIGVVILDVNGLKITNDTMGHEMGDVLLKAAAEAISGSVRSSDFVARIGGDEFSIILQNSSETVVKKLVEKLERNVESFNRHQDALILSIAYGWTICTDPRNMIAAIREADDRMYEKKAECKQLLRSRMAKAWMDALVSRGIQSEKRIDRLGSIMQSFCDFLGLDASETGRLVLLARYHDIGLVALNTKCVLKPGALDDSEYAVIKKHVDAGHRLACECEELKVIADWIQKHHEYWDGSGYPSGLIGESIPIQCRILSLVDAFESMTTEQLYRHARSVEAAMEEIERHLGTQFDPVMGKKFIAFINDIPEYIYGDIVD